MIEQHDTDLHKQRITRLIVSYSVCSIVLYVIINVFFTYFFLFAKAGEYMATPEGVPAGYYTFNWTYLFRCGVKEFNPPTVLSFALGGAMFFCYKLDQNFMIKNGNKNIKGDARWSTEKDLANNPDFYCADYDKLELAEKSGTIVARIGNHLYCDTSTTHSVVIGTTRSGKGQMYVLPKLRFIAMSKEKHSFVVNDPKGEICENLYNILKENGYEVVILNLRDTNHSSLWDPLKVIKDEYVKAMTQDEPDLSRTIDLAESLGHVFTDDPKENQVWPNSARELLVSMILYLIDMGYRNNNLDKVTMYSVHQFFIELGSINRVVVRDGAKQMVNALDELFQKLPIGHPAKSAYSASNFAAGEMRGSIKSILATDISIFGTDMGISKLTSGSQIDFDKLVETDKPCAIFMVVPDEKPNRHVIASLFVNQCYERLVDIATAYPMQRLPQRVIFELDEFGNMVRIPSMDNKITVAAGRNILFSLYCQDLNQLDTKYDNAAKTIRSNCGNVIYVYSIDKDTNEYMSALLGQKTLLYKTYSGSLSEWLNHQSVNVDSQPLLSAEQLSRLDVGESVMKRMRCYPSHTKLEPFYKLGIKPTNLNDIPIEIIPVSLKKSIYPLDKIAATIGLNLHPDVAPSKNPSEEKRKPAIKFEEIDASEPDSLIKKPYNDKEAKTLPKSFEKMQKLTNNAFGEYINQGDYDTALRLLKGQTKIKKNLSSTEELELTDYIKKQQNK